MLRRSSSAPRISGADGSTSHNTIFIGQQWGDRYPNRSLNQSNRWYLSRNISEATREGVKRIGICYSPVEYEYYPARKDVAYLSINDLGEFRVVRESAICVPA